MADVPFTLRIPCGANVVEAAGVESTLSKSLAAQAPLRFKKAYDSRGSYNIAIVTLDLPERATLR